MTQSLVDPQGWRYEDTFAKPSSMYRLRRSLSRFFANPLALNPVTSGAGYPSEKAPSVDNRRSWASSLFRIRTAASSRASSRVATRLFVRGKERSPLDEEIPPLPPAYDRRTSRQADAWSRSSMAPSEASSGLRPFRLKPTSPPPPLHTPTSNYSRRSGSVRDSITFGGGSRRSRYSFAASRKSTHSMASTAETTLSERSGEVSSVAELPLPPLPVVGTGTGSAWSSSSTDNEGSVRSGSSGRASSSVFGDGGGVVIALGPAVHPLRAHSVRPVVNQGAVGGKGGSWPL
jgi:hypothetical protein